MQRKSFFRTAVISVAVFSLAGSLSSCQKKIEDEILEKAIEQSTGNDVELNTATGKMSIESDGKKIEVQSEHASWPADMPAGIPKFSYGTVKAVTRTETSGARGWTVACENIPESSIREYDAELKQRGFETVLTLVTSDRGAGGSINATKGAVSVFLMADQGTATLAVSEEIK